MTFTLSGRKLVLDCNEDGFDEEDVKAICRTGQSEKKNRAGYIGEKGIGFKSVFRVAEEVKIQSGPFSFYFDAKAPDGLGLITPWDAEYEDLPDHTGTRLTLRLKDPQDQNKRQEELCQLPETLLLFLHKLRSISIHIDGIYEPIQLTHHYKFDEKLSVGTLTTTENGSSKEKRFYIIKHRISDLPVHRSRKDIFTAEIVLAFPVDKSGKPLIHPQYIFAYLPVRKCGLSVSLVSFAQ